jgi:hypothetical protein
MAVVVPHPLECQMSKRKPATASKSARSPKITAKAQRASQAIVRSPKDNSRRSVKAGSTEASPKRHSHSGQDAPVAANPASFLKDASAQTTMKDDLKHGSDFSSAATNVRAYQEKLLEIAQSNIQFSFEFTQRLAAIKSPVEIFSVIAELTSKRIAMFGKHISELSIIKR